MLSVWIGIIEYNAVGYEWWYVGETAVYVVLGILIIAFLFFVGNTIRCYLNKPRYVDDEEDADQEMNPNISGKIWLLPSYLPHLLESFIS